MNHDARSSQDTGGGVVAAATLPLTTALDQRRGGVLAHARQAVVRWLDRRAGRQHWRQLYELDERTLRDLGLSRSELRSVAAEADQQAELTRRRIDHAYLRNASRGLKVRPVEAYLSFVALFLFGSLLLNATHAAL